MTIFETAGKPEVLSLGTDAEYGASLMFDFADEFLDIMKKGGKAVVHMFDDESGDETETWIFKDDQYVCEKKKISYNLEEFIDFLNQDECGGIEVYLDDKLKIEILPI